VITIREIQEKALQGESSFAATCENLIQKIHQRSKLNAFLSVESQRAHERAKWADEQLSRAGGKIPAHLPLLGVPVAIKDNLQWSGSRTTCASKMLENYCSPFSATSVSRLERAGAVILGKTNLDEFAMGGSGEHSAFGPALNPRDETRVPGGSSSGSAAAVAAGLVPVALGSDTGGSIRLPASFCGVVGLKPTYGRVSRHGLVAFASSLDQVGPLGATMEDVSQVQRVIEGFDPLDSTSIREIPPLPLAVQVRGVRIGVPQEFFADDPSAASGLQPEVRLRVEQALQKYESLGAKLVPISLPHVRHAVSCYYLIAVAEASSNLSRFDGIRFGTRGPRVGEAKTLEDFYCENRSLFGKEVKRRILLGTFVLSAGFHEAYYKRARIVRELIRADFEVAFSQVDLIASPVAPTTAFKLGEQNLNPIQMYLNDLYTIPANLAGLPAISLPVGSDSLGLPVGLQLIGSAHSETLLIQLGRALEGSL